MRHSAQSQIGSRAWLESKCREGECQGAWTVDHGERVKRIQRFYPALTVGEVVKHAFANECGPSCSNQV
jgi:hypothetical protein